MSLCVKVIWKKCLFSGEIAELKFVVHVCILFLSSNPSPIFKKRPTPSRGMLQAKLMFVYWCIHNYYCNTMSAQTVVYLILAVTRGLNIYNIYKEGLK